jgi:hypothetical protein
MDMLINIGLIIVLFGAIVGITKGLQWLLSRAGIVDKYGRINTIE